MTTLDTFASQQTFRALLHALAHPGRVVELPAEVLSADRPPALVVPLALADLDEVVAVLGGDADRWSAELVTATSCSLGGPSEAHQVVVLDGATAELVASLSVGTPLAPELGCRLVLAATTVAVGAHAGRGPTTEPAGPQITLTVRGPGVADTATVAVGGIAPQTFTALAAANAAFPTGIDTFVVSGAGQVVGLPRSSTIDIEEAP